MGKPVKKEPEVKVKIFRPRKGMKETLKKPIGMNKVLFARLAFLLKRDLN